MAHDDQRNPPPRKSSAPTPASTSELWSAYHSFSNDLTSKRVAAFNKGLNRALDGNHINLGEFGKGKGQFGSMHRDDEESYVKNAVGSAFDKAYWEGYEGVAKAAKVVKSA